MFGFSWIKIAFIAFFALSFIGMGWMIKYQNNKINDLTVSLKSEKQKTKELNETIDKQNKSIIESNAKYEEVQKQLDKSMEINKDIRSEFRKFKGLLNKKPIPQTCEAANTEMIEVGKQLGEKWKK
jgi:septation ring formation regulator EzrA